MNEEELFPCVGICLPDADEAYCIGCGRPWGQKEHDGESGQPGNAESDDGGRTEAA